MQVLVNAFEPEKMLARVSSCQGLWPPASADATPEVDGQFAVDPDGDGGTDLVALAEVAFEGVADALEARGAGTVDGDARRVSHESS